MQALKGVDLFETIDSTINPPENVLGIYSKKMDEVVGSCHYVKQAKTALVRYWLLQDPLASWRKIIYQLDLWAGYEQNLDIADSIRHYAEELTGMCSLIKPLQVTTLSIICMWGLHDCNGLVQAGD